MNVTLNGLQLPDDLIWRDEFDWAPVEQVVTPTLSGALLVEETAKPEGRPITLVGHCPRATVLSVKALEAQVAQRNAELSARLAELSEARHSTEMANQSLQRALDQLEQAASTAAMASKSFKVPLRISINILSSFSSECTTVPAQRQRSCRFFLFGPFASAAAPCYNGYIASRKGADTPCPLKTASP